VEIQCDVKLIIIIRYRMALQGAALVMRGTTVLVYHLPAVLVMGGSKAVH
jgi:hypothetical protein